MRGKTGEFPGRNSTGSPLITRRSNVSEINTDFIARLVSFYRPETVGFANFVQFVIDVKVMPQGSLFKIFTMGYFLWVHKTSHMENVVHLGLNFAVPI